MRRGGVIAGHRVVVGALNHDAQLRDIIQPAGIGDPVAEELDQLLPGTQALHRDVVVINHVGISAVGIDGQGAVEPGYNSGAGNRGERCGAGLRHGANAGDGLGFAIGNTVDVGVVGQHVAGGVAARCAVGDAASLNGNTVVIHALGGVVGALDRHRQGSGGGGAREVADHVVEAIGQGLACQSQSLYQRVVVIDHVFIGTVAADQQLPVLPGDHQHADDWGLNAGTRRAHRHHMQLVGIGGDVHVGVVGQHVAPWVDADGGVVGAAGLDCCGAVGDRDRCVVDRCKDDLQGVGVGQCVCCRTG
ncbi:hypothetical protein D3C87_1039080 [compost metagenome]